MEEDEEAVLRLFLKICRFYERHENWMQVFCTNVIIPSDITSDFPFGGPNSQFHNAIIAITTPAC
jgi:hypothetical protein